MDDLEIPHLRAVSLMDHLHFSRKWIAIALFRGEIIPLFIIISFFEGVISFKINYYTVNLF